MKKWHKILKKDTITEERINQSVRRILKLKMTPVRDKKVV